MSGRTARHPSVTGVGLTPFGRQPGRSALEWQSTAAQAALTDAGLSPRDVDGIIVGYATTSPHLMPANRLAERLGIRPRIAFGTSVGGATGLAMVAQAAALLSAGAAATVLVVAGEDRASGQSTFDTTQVLAQVGEPSREVPLGVTVPGYYALLASRYLHQHGLDAAALAPLAVQMRLHASLTEGAHHAEAIEVEDVTRSRIVSSPLRLLDCCPISDGGAAVVLSAAKSDRSVAVLGTGQAHEHQHLSAIQFNRLGARVAAERAFIDAGLRREDIDVFGVYDSFTITLALLLEDLGMAEPGGAGDLAGTGALAWDGSMPTNTHGGLLSYGHPGVAGGLAHLVEVVRQLRGEAHGRQVRACRRGYVHGDGGILSAHVGLVLGREMVS